MNKYAYVGSSRIIRVSSFLNKAKIENKDGIYLASSTYTSRTSYEIDFDGEYGGKTVAGCFMYFSYYNRRWNPQKQVMLMDDLVKRCGIYGGFMMLTSIVSSIALHLGTNVLTRVGDGSLGKYYIQHLSQEREKFGSALVGLWRYPINSSVVYFPIASFLSSGVFVSYNPSNVCCTDVGYQYIDAYHNEVEHDVSLSKMVRYIDRFEDIVSGYRVLLFGDDVYGNHSSKDVVYFRAYFRVMKQSGRNKVVRKKEPNIRVNDAYKSLRKVNAIKRIMRRDNHE
ncbi:MAG: hypothetical protein QXU32_06875 [Nitrososphaerales archaeon]